MSADTNAASRGSPAGRVLDRVFVAGLVLAVPVFFFCTALAVPVLAWAGLGSGYVYFVGPPLDFDRPHDGQVVAHIDVFGKVPPDIARIRVSEAATGATVWDVTAATARTECWNRCWNLTLQAGANPASFAAGHQRFNPSVPQGPSFSLTGERRISSKSGTAKVASRTIDSPCSGAGRQRARATGRPRRSATD